MPWVPLAPSWSPESNVYFGLTAGHVLPDGDRELVVKTGDGELEANLKVAGRYIWAQGRPIAFTEEDEKSGGDRLNSWAEMVIPNATKTNLLTLCSGQGRSRPHTHPPPSLVLSSYKGRAQDIYIIHQSLPLYYIYVPTHTDLQPLSSNKGRAQDIYIIHQSLPLYYIYIPIHSLLQLFSSKKADCRIFISFTLLPTPL